MKFRLIGRERELNCLDRLWDRETAQFLVLSGQRRVGKTALLVEWLRRSGRRALYWAASPASAAVQLQAFSQAIHSFSHPDTPVPEHFTYASWGQAFQEIVSLARDQRLAVLIDEFTVLLESNPWLASEMQALWDQHLSRANLFLCLSGSDPGVMLREVLSYQAPLYGRASAYLYLKPFYFGETRAFFPEYSAADRLAIYSIFGGIAADWLRLDHSKSVPEIIESELLAPDNLIQAEPRRLLSNLKPKPQNYFSILGALANGAQTLQAITQVTGFQRVKARKYLNLLTETGFVEPRESLTTFRPARERHYHLTHPYLRFYFRFLANRQAQALADIIRDMPDFIGTTTWKEICREWMIRAGAVDRLPALPGEVGSAWNDQAEVDVAGLDVLDQVIFLGECRWDTKFAEQEVLTDLVSKKAPLLIPKNGNWKVIFLGFSRRGWTHQALSYQDEISRHPPSGSNWNTIGLHLLDLDQVDQGLDEMTNRPPGLQGEIEF